MSGERLVVQTDASVRPGRLSRLGWVLIFDGCVVASGGGTAPCYGSHVAEMAAVVRGALAALSWLEAVDVEISAVHFQMDSQSLADQLSGGAKIRGPELSRMRALIQSMLSVLPATVFTWVPRADNWAADRLTREAREPRAPRRSAVTLTDRLPASPPYIFFGAVASALRSAGCSVDDPVDER